MQARTAAPEPAEPEQVGRYLLFHELGTGGMATVYLARALGAGGFTRTVAVKRLHPHWAKSEQAAKMLLDEANVAARIRHPNVVAILDVVQQPREMLLVMEYVHGQSLAYFLNRLRHQQLTMPLPILSAVVHDVLAGLDAAHRTTDEDGRRLGVIHRDVSPQNVLVGTDGIARITDFGVAKAEAQLHTTTEGTIRGKLAYMAPEQLGEQPLDCRADLFSTGVLLWEAATGRPLFARGNANATMAEILYEPIPDPRSAREDLPEALAEVITRSLNKAPEERFSSAREMAQALVEAVASASAFEVAEWIQTHASEPLRELDSIRASMKTPQASVPADLEDSDQSVGATMRTRRKRKLTMAVFLASVTVFGASAGVALRASENRAQSENEPHFGSNVSTPELTTAQSAPQPPTASAAPLAIPPLDSCPGGVTQPTDGLIDDFEDGDLRTLAVGRRKEGIWTADTHGNAIVKQLAVVTTAGSRQALKISGSTDGGHIHLRFPIGYPYDASSYDAITFRAKAEATPTVDFKLRVGDRNTWPAVANCEKCNDAHTAPLTLTTEWREHTVRFSELKMEGWGKPVGPLYPSETYFRAFQVAGTGKFTLWLDDVAFAVCN